MDFVGVRAVPARSVALGNASEERHRYAVQLEAEHTDRVDAIVGGDGQAARDAARRHLVNSIQRHHGKRRRAVSGAEGGGPA